MKHHPTSIEFETRIQVYTIESLVGKLVVLGDRTVGWDVPQAFYLVGHDLPKMFSKALPRCVTVILQTFVCPEPRKGILLIEVLVDNQSYWVEAEDCFRIA